MSPAPSLHTGKALVPALHRSDYTELRRMPFPSLFVDSGRLAALNPEVHSPLAFRPAFGLATLPHQWEAALTSRCGAELVSLVGFSDGLSTYTEHFFFFESVEWDKSVIKEHMASNVQSSGTGKLTLGEMEIR